METPRRDMTANRIEWIHLDRAAVGALQVGDLVSAAAGGLPTYRVVAVAVADQQALVREEVRGASLVMPLGKLYWKAVSAA
jgi:hypothetical protein